MGKKLTSLVQAAPEFMPYTLTCLGAGLPPASHGGDRDFAGRVQSLRIGIIAPLGGPLVLFKRLEDMLGKERQRQALELSKQRQQEALEDALLEAGEKLLATKLFQQSSLQLFLNKLASENPKTLQKQIKDNNPLVRWLVASAIGSRHLHLESDLIERLSDPHPYVREAAHVALIRIARGTDFGPFPGSTRRGIDRSIKKWRNWLVMQQSVSPEKSAKDAAIAAAGKQGKPATLEIVPLVLVHDDKPALSYGVTKACDELVNAKGDEQISILARLSDAVNSDSTQTLALAIPKLSGDIQQQARDALTERLTRLPSVALRDKLQDDNPDVRSAAALACGRKIAKERMPDLLQLLDDPEMTVVQSARVALTELSGEDFGPTSDADRRGQAEAVAAWRKWWKERQNTKP